MHVIRSFHAHIYYDETSFDQADKLCDEAGDKFQLSVGRKHKKPVGPHPKWSCQLAFQTELFGSVVPWLALNRNGLTIFIHANTGDDLKDHTEHTIWMGKMERLNLDMFKSKV
ncbi:MAG: DOPA 4,5-dioxygenase family protein [Mariprofundaceae bacterium]|nr:DOPA 4,5-dioxygenase family protein [Mariprofundaceae bacterium]